MTDLIKLYKEIKDIEAIISNIIQNEEDQEKQVSKIKEDLKSENNILYETNYINYFRLILI